MLPVVLRFFRIQQLCGTFFARLYYLCLVTGGRICLLRL